MYRDIGIEYEFGEIDAANIKKHWRKADEQKAKEERARKRRRGNDNEVIVDESENENEKAEEKDLEQAKTKDSENKDSEKLWTEDNKIIIFGAMVGGNYMRLDVKFRKQLLNKILGELVPTKPIFSKLSVDNMKDRFIKRKRIVLKLYKENDEAAIQRLPESDKLILQYLKDSNIADMAVRLTGFAS